jgi:7-cyano-7-deazaguanine synthase
MNICVLASGGLDSAVLLGEALRAGHTVHPVYVRCGLAWEKAERHWLGRYLKAIRSPRLKPLSVLRVDAADLYGPHWSTTGRRAPGYRSADAAVYLPGRNLLLLSKAAVFCARRRLAAVWLGLLKGNPFPDATPAFLKAMQKAASLALGTPIAVRAPFAGLSKARVLSRGRDLPLRLAFSCLSPRGLRPCGACNKCAERDKALKAM